MTLLANKSAWLRRRVRGARTYVVRILSSPPLSEARVHLDRISQGSRSPRIAVSVGDDNNGFSSGLRGFAVAYELRKLGWRSIVLPRQLSLSQRQRILRRECVDVVLLQKSRHPLNRPRFYPDTVCVFDIDDADFVEPSLLDGIIECLEQSAHVVAGSRFVAEFSRRYNPNVDIVWTGSKPRKRVHVDKEYPPVVAWAISNISFYPAELEFVADVLSRLQNRNWQFWLFGVSDPELTKSSLKFLEAMGIPCHTFSFMKYQHFLTKLDSVSIGLAPLVPSASEFSAGKSFGKVLGYLNCGVPIVASNCAEHPMFFRHGVNGFLASNAAEFAESIELLLSDISLRQQVSQHAYADYVEHLSIASVARKMDALLRPLVGN